MYTHVRMLFLSKYMIRTTFLILLFFILIGLALLLDKGSQWVMSFSERPGARFNGSLVTRTNKSVSPPSNEMQARRLLQLEQFPRGPRHTLDDKDSGNKMAALRYSEHSRKGSVHNMSLRQNLDETLVQRLLEAAQPLKGKDNIFRASASVKEDKNEYTLETALNENQYSIQSEFRHVKMVRDAFSHAEGLNKSNFQLLNGRGFVSLKNSCTLLTNTQRRILHSSIVSNFTLKDNDQRDIFINLHRYGYIIDSPACLDKPTLAILVHSKFNNYNNREKIRQTWAFNSSIYGITVRTIFFIGQPNPEELARDHTERKDEKNRRSKWERERDFTQQKIESEAKLYGDMVMGNFTDSYRNLTIKHIMAFSWLLSHCPSVSHVAKVDDDVVVNVYRLVRYIEAADSNKSSVLLCHLLPVRRVLRDRSKKWYVSPSEYPFQVYPPWCLGYAIVMSRDVVQRLYHTSSSVRPFWIDDVYVTGIVAWKAGVTPVSFNRNMSTVLAHQFHANHSSAMFIMSRFTQKHPLARYWRQLVAAQVDLDHIQTKDRERNE